MDCLDGVVMLMALEVTTVFIEAPWSVNPHYYVEEPRTPPPQPALCSSRGLSDEE